MFLPFFSAFLLLVYADPASVSGPAKQQVTCTHPQVCRLVIWGHEVSETLSPQSIEAISPIDFSSVDPHHFEPTMNDIRELIEAPVLITMPLAYQPWLRRVLRERARRAELKTLSLDLENWARHYPNASTEALSHFWLFPEGVCASLEQVFSFLEIEKSPTLTQTHCTKYSEELKNIFTLLNKKNSHPIIISHNALAPLFNKYHVNYLALRGAGHSERISSRQIRQLEEILRQARRSEHSLYWINEHQIMARRPLNQYVLETDLVLDFASDGLPSTKGAKMNGADIWHPIDQLKNFFTQ